MEQVSQYGQYSYTKAMRLKLKHMSGDIKSLFSVDKTTADNEKEAMLRDMIDAGRVLLKELQAFIYASKKTDKGNEVIKDSTGNPMINCRITINKKWLKLYFNTKFYQNNKKATTYQLHTIIYAKEYLVTWMKEWEENLKFIEEANNSAEHSRKRRAFIAESLQALSKKNGFRLINDFAEYATHKDKSNGKFKDAIVQFKTKLDQALINYAPAQGSGLLLCKAVLNYYTVNKFPKSYEEEHRKLICKYEKINSEYNEMKRRKKEQKRKLFEYIAQNKESKINDLDLFCDDKEVLKEFICLQKKINSTDEDLRRVQQQQSLETIPDFKTLKEKKDCLNKKKAMFFVSIKNECPKFKKWNEFCSEYKAKATKRGETNARKKGIEKERVESQINRFWAVIYKTKNEYQLLCIPQDYREGAKAFLQKKVCTTDAIDDNLIYSFTSLTKRALHKLCFSEQGTFYKEMPEYLRDMRQRVEQATTIEKKIKQSEKSKAVLELCFYKKLLADKYALERLDLESFDLTQLHQEKTLNDFESALEKACYRKQAHSLTLDDFNFFLKEYNILRFALCSYDLEGRNKNTYQTPESEQKRHTRELWYRFWSNDDPTIRLNPEISIRYREVDHELKRYLQFKGFDLEKIRHRRLQDQFTSTFTFELNAGTKYPQLAFAKPEEIAERIDIFNQEFNRCHWHKAWRYGIDRGQKELATLCLVKFSNTKNSKGTLEPLFPNARDDIKVYELRKEFYNHKAISNLENKPFHERKERRIACNISYFIDKVEDCEWFIEKTSTCIDLTTAKVIRNKIVLNGDLYTFLKLKKEAAKRILFEEVATKAITENNYSLEWKITNQQHGVSAKNDELTLRVNNNKKGHGRPIYFFEGDFSKRLVGLEMSDGSVYTKEVIKNYLQNFLRNLLKEKYSSNKANDQYLKAREHVPTIAKINHLRNALVANMVGVIFHLQKKYPGIIMLEDLEKEEIDKHFQGHHINISRRLEYALYEKMQTLGTVPPHVKDIIELREVFHQQSKKSNKSEDSKNNVSLQIGGLVFVDKCNTSQNCPCCGKPASWRRKIKNKLKYERSRFACGSEDSCGFDTARFNSTQKVLEGDPQILKTEKDFSLYRDLDDPDKVAAYNIAKKHVQPEEIKKWKDYKKLSKE